MRVMTYHTHRTRAHLPIRRGPLTALQRAAAFPTAAIKTGTTDGLLGCNLQPCPSPLLVMSFSEFYFSFVPATAVLVF